MKKICFITTVFGTLRTFVLPLVRYIHDNTDWDISFICSYDKDFAESLPDYIHYFPVEMKRGISLSGIKAAREIRKIFKREKFDLIQYSTPNASLYASVAGKLAKVPNRLYCQWGIVFVSMKGIKRRIFKLEEKFVCSLSTWVEPDSKGNLDFCHDEKIYPADKGSVIGNGSACGVNFEKFNIEKKAGYRMAIREKYGIPEDAFVFIFVGRITKDKGINELLSAFIRMLGEKRDVYLFVLGKEEGLTTLDRELYDDSKNSDHIIYTGRSGIVEEYLSASDCYILPSYREGFGMGTIEAQAMGVPVIVTDIPGPRDAIIPGRSGLLIKKQDPGSLYEAMNKAYSHCTDGFGEIGHEFVKEKFDQKDLLKLIVEDRKRILGE